MTTMIHRSVRFEYEGQKREGVVVGQSLLGSTLEIRITDGKDDTRSVIIGRDTSVSFVPKQETVTP